MFNVNDFFRNPPLSMDGIIRSTLMIFVTNWQTFMAMNIARIIFIFGLGSVILFIITSFTNDRLLYLINTCIASNLTTTHFFNNNKDNDYSCQYGKIWEDISMEMGIFYVTMSYILITTCIIISSFFEGAMIHAVVETYKTGGGSLTQSIRLGWKKISKIFGFRYFIFMSTIVGGMMAFILMLPLNLLRTTNALMLSIIITIVTVVLALFVLGSTMIVGVPSIVVEDKSSVEAFQRSWNLCKDSICLITFTVLCFYSLVISMIIAIETMMESIIGGGVFAVIIGVIGLVVVPALGTILSVVMYVSFRIRYEDYKLSDLTDELNTIAEADLTPVVLTDELL